MNLEMQKLLLEHLASSKDLYARTASIIKPSYFDLEYKRVMALLHAYFELYSSLPSFDVIKAECGIELTQRQMGHNEFVYWCDQCEQFAKRSGMIAAVKNGVKDIAEGNYDNLAKAVTDAITISLDRDMGVELYENPREELERCNEQLEFIPTGIKLLDDKLGGGVTRKQMTLFSANSGVGKSIIMSNIGDNIARSGYHVLYISLELPQNMIYTRLAAISSGESIKTWRSNIPKMATKMEHIKESEKVATYRIKRMPNGSTTNDIRAFVKLYELQFGRLPDVIMVDYLDLMSPNGGVKGLGISEQDKLKSEQLYEVGIECNAAIITASQQNRSGITEADSNQTVIAGGFSKLNILDNYISLKMDDLMRLEGIMIAKFLKTRSSDAVGSKIPLNFNANNLRITDVNDLNRINQLLSRFDPSGKKETKTFTKNKQNVTIQGSVEGLSSNEIDSDDNVPQRLKELFEEF
jgi:replicative DNA helicase